MSDTVFLLRALQFAAHKHRFQRRKNSDASPYINHPIAAAELLARVGGVTDPVTIAAAVLHDTLEDTETTPDELEREFGIEVRGIVEEVTDDKALPKDVRKKLQIEHTSHLSPKAKLVKLVDKACNVIDVAHDPPPDWDRERRVNYFDWSEQVVSGCRGGNAALEDYFDAMITAGRTALDDLHKSLMPDPRPAIIAQYAEWTALSALRSGAPIKSRQDVYTALRNVDFATLFDMSLGVISSQDFDTWHERAVTDLRARDNRLNVGWAAKILNVYLKTRCYVGAQGRPGLADAVHPPIDGGLWLGLERRFAHRPDILERSNCVRRIKDINDHACYEHIIDGCRAAAQELGCRLIEVEQLWAGTEIARPESGCRA